MGSALSFLEAKATYVSISKQKEWNREDQARFVVILFTEGPDSPFLVLEAANSLCLVRLKLAGCSV
jgi:hypothetical protein